MKQLSRKKEKGERRKEFKFLAKICNRKLSIHKYLTTEA